MRKTKILLLIAKDGFSFVNQAKALAKGLSQLNIDNELIRYTENFSEGLITKYQPTTVIGVGSWHSYPELVSTPQKMGFHVMPWFVSDDKVESFIKELNQLDFFLTTSNYCKNIFVRDGINEKKIKVVHEAVDPDFWKPIHDSRFLDLISIRDQYIELPLNYDLKKAKEENIPILFTTGGDATNKGAQEILQALALIDKKIKWIYLIKTWPSPGSFQRGIEELNLAIKEHFWEHIRYISGEFSREFIRNLMNICDIYIACSRTEGFGLPLVEAQMCGKPVITIKATSTQEVVIDGVGGLVCPSVETPQGPRANINELAIVLEKILLDSKLRVKLGAGGRKFAKDTFSPRIIAKKILNLI
jgi:starch synthase